MASLERGQLISKLNRAYTLMLRYLFFFLSGESLDDEYGQEVSVRKPGEKVTGPPILPPHLLQVILNKDIPAHVCILI